MSFWDKDGCFPFFSVSTCDEPYLRYSILFVGLFLLMAFFMFFCVFLASPFDHSIAQKNSLIFWIILIYPLLINSLVSIFPGPVRFTLHCTILGFTQKIVHAIGFLFISREMILISALRKQIIPVILNKVFVFLQGFAFIILFILEIWVLSPFILFFEHYTFNVALFVNFFDMCCRLLFIVAGTHAYVFDSTMRDLMTEKYQKMFKNLLLFISVCIFLSSAYYLLINMFSIEPFTFWASMNWRDRRTSLLYFTFIFEFFVENIPSIILAIILVKSSMIQDDKIVINNQEMNVPNDFDTLFQRLDQDYI